ncbi:hypothetical protein LCGC14_1534950 [marine sediment metagenome]|uniref:Uncharacterized protein n=1 Tax=marine sediment metagenome TaxID=412755 RepID=A0A0F9LAI0_9ZZZZ
MAKASPMPKMATVTKIASAKAEEASTALQFIEDYEMKEQTDLEWATEAAKSVKDDLDAVNTERRKFVDPLKQVIKDLEAAFKPAIQSLKKCEMTLKTKMTDYIMQAAVERDRLLAEAGDQYEGGDDSAGEVLVEEAETKVVEKVSGMSTRESWVGEVTDAQQIINWAIGNNRPDLLAPDIKILKALTKAKGGDLKIPGWRAFSKTVVAIRR